MAPAARKRCDFPGCDRGPPQPDGEPDCYITPENLATHEQVKLDLKEHVEMAHILPIKAMEAEEKRFLAQANLVKAEADKILAERDPTAAANTTTAACTTSGPVRKNPPSYDRRRSLRGRWGVLRGTMGEIRYRDRDHGSSSHTATMGSLHDPAPKNSPQRWLRHHH